MTEKGYKQLVIDTEFKNLIRPLRKEEYMQLELNLVVDGCRDPIIVWNNTIVDGHNRYEICNRMHIPYATQEIEFESREAAVVWICSNQLGRRNITEETRKYLIGRQYEAEKLVGCQKNANGYNQYTNSHDTEIANSPDDLASRDQKESSRRTAWRLGEEYHISSGTVQKYARYSQALDAIAEKVPELIPQILSGSYKISHENVVAISMMDAEEVRKLNKKIGKGPVPFIRYSESRRDISGDATSKPTMEVPDKPAIKTMPAFDPDAEVAGLTLTIPSWTSSIERTKSTADLNIISSSAKNKLEEALEALQSKVQEMLSAIKGDT
ncbi:hypothetical protein [uncultured Oscillibacter sp.]|uniref:hypothetical protein n=1 Tax=uncultured Oscillibacter sp. TaxID=876091 RepID=UPI0025D71A29|nr:hypothetical protein [uncultured Oscillibacter sp.]